MRVFISLSPFFFKVKKKIVSMTYPSFGQPRKSYVFVHSYINFCFCFSNSCYTKVPKGVNPTNDPLGCYSWGHILFFIHVSRLVVMCSFEFAMKDLDLFHYFSGIEVIPFPKKLFFLNHNMLGMYLKMF